MFITARLLTASREFVQLAAIPPFGKPPALVAFGSRTFALEDDSEDGSIDKVLIYVETQRPYQPTLFWAKDEPGEVDWRTLFEQAEIDAAGRRHG